MGKLINGNGSPLARPSLSLCQPFCSMFRHLTIHRERFKDVGKRFRGNSLDAFAQTLDPVCRPMFGIRILRLVFTTEFMLTSEFIVSRTFLMRPMKFG